MCYNQLKKGKYMKLINLVKSSLMSIKKENLKTLHKDKISVSITSDTITIKEMKYKENSRDRERF